MATGRFEVASARLGSYPRILGRYVRDEKLLTLEAAIHKMTGAPAARVGLKERGLIKEGMFADITVFDPAKVIDRATFESPNQYPIGIDTYGERKDQR
jgi:N-acyl-D-aspartate/D-glutamate deacylase